jgi:hypothetical protein
MPAPARIPRAIMVYDEQVAERLRAEEPKINQRIARIEAEIAAPDRASLKDDDWSKEWAGQYYEGDGLSENVRIDLAPRSGIAYLNHGCLGLYGGDHGEVVEVLPDGLRLKLALGEANGSFLSERVYFVKWGERRYLVPDWAMTQLVNNYNEGGFSRSAMYGIPRMCPEGKGRYPLNEALPEGKPELPAEFAGLLRDGPIKLKVASVSPLERRSVIGSVVAHECTIEFEGGSDQGVYAGLEFWYRASPSLVSGKVRITRVDAKTCTGELVALGAEKREFKPPAVEEILTMKLRYRRLPGGTGSGDDQDRLGGQEPVGDH